MMLSPGYRDDSIRYYVYYPVHRIVAVTFAIRSGRGAHFVIAEGGPNRASVISLTPHPRRQAQGTEERDSLYTSIPSNDSLLPTT